MPVRPMSTLTGELDHAACHTCHVITRRPRSAGYDSLVMRPVGLDDAATQAEAILTTLGDQMRVDREAYIDMATAL